MARRATQGPPVPLPIVHAHQGELLDQVAARVYGDTAMTMALLDANPHLAEPGAVLPHGTAVRLPPRRKMTKAITSLWD